MAGIYHNSAYIIDFDGSEAGLYHKMHIQMTLMKKFLFHSRRFVLKPFQQRKEK
jgi:N-carbamoylputrescine amidase